MVFLEPRSSTFTIGEKTLTYYRVYINTRNQGGNSNLILATPEVFSFGLASNKDEDAQKQEKYSLCLCLRNKNEPTPEQEEFVKTLKKIIDKCIEHFMQIRKTVKKLDTTEPELRKVKEGISPLCFTVDDDGQIKNGPTLYAKLITKNPDKSKDQTTPQIISKFYDANDVDVSGKERVLANPLDLLNKKCYVRAALKIESIFIGAKIRIQVKLHEALVSVISSEPERLLLSSASNTQKRNVEEEYNDDDRLSIS